VTPAGKPKASAVCAVVVTFQPPPSLLDNMRELAAEASEIVIVDNSSDPRSADLLRLIERQFGARLLLNGRNLGIAAALNLGIRHAIAKGYAWVATFDQDSTITAGFFDAMLAAHQASAIRELVPLVAPVLCVSNEDYQARRNRQAGPLSSLTRTAMSSGSLIKTDIFQKVGFYDEGFFMDYVDYDFCLRLWQQGWKLIRARQAFLLHRLGLARTHRFLGMKITIKSHTPWRRYHIMRNRVIVFRRFAFSSPLWCLYDFSWIFLELTKILLFEPEKLTNLRLVLKGIADGLAGKAGPLPSTAV
jgi:rhamnosyltransferase